MNDGVKRRTIVGLAWTFSQQFSVQFINFGVQILLARLLIPEEFGIIGMITIFIAIGNSLVDSGMTSSLIRTKDADQRDYSTVFWMNLLLSLLIYLSLYFAAPLIANFFHEVILINIIRVYSLTFLIRALVSVQITRLTKEMNFKTQMKIQVPSVVISGVIGVVLAVNGYGVWSIVWMNVMQAILITIQYWVYIKWVPLLIIDKILLKKHLGFGYKLTLSGLLNTFYNNIYNVIIGRYFSAVELGYFTRAYTFQMFPIQNLSTALNKVTYPLFSSIQDDDVKLKSTYKKLMQHVIFWVAPLMFFCIISAEVLFRFVLTEKWVPAVPYFQLLCLSGILYPLHSYNLNILNVKGRSDLFLKLEIYKKVFITIGLMFAIPYGVYGLLFFNIITSIVSFAINTIYSGKLIAYSRIEQLKDISPALIIALITAIVSYYMISVISLKLPMNDLSLLILNFFVFWPVYLFLCKVSNVSALSEIKNLILKQ